MKIIGIIGAKGAGKTTLTKELLAKLSKTGDRARHSFANTLKLCCIEQFNMTSDGIIGEAKETMCQYGITHRQFMEDFGGAMRKIDKDFWVKILATKLKNLEHDIEYAVIDDVRHVNEMDYVLGYNGAILKLNRGWDRLTQREMDCHDGYSYDFNYTGIIQVPYGLNIISTRDFALERINDHFTPRRITTREDPDIEGEIPVEARLTRLEEMVHNMLDKLNE